MEDPKRLELGMLVMVSTSQVWSKAGPNEVFVIIPCLLVHKGFLSWIFFYEFSTKPLEHALNKQFMK